MSLATMIHTANAAAVVSFVILRLLFHGMQSTEATKSGHVIILSNGIGVFNEGGFRDKSYTSNNPQSGSDGNYKGDTMGNIPHGSRLTPVSEITVFHIDSKGKGRGVYANRGKNAGTVGGGGIYQSTGQTSYKGSLGSDMNSHIISNIHNSNTITIPVEESSKGQVFNSNNEGFIQISDEDSQTPQLKGSNKVWLLENNQFHNHQQRPTNPHSYHQIPSQFNRDKNENADESKFSKGGDDTAKDNDGHVGGSKRNNKHVGFGHQLKGGGNNVFNQGNANVYYTDNDDKGLVKITEPKKPSNKGSNQGAKISKVKHPKGRVIVIPILKHVAVVEHIPVIEHVRVITTEEDFQIDQGSLPRTDGKVTTLGSSDPYDNQLGAQYDNYNNFAQGLSGAYSGRLGKNALVTILSASSGNDRELVSLDEGKGISGSRSDNPKEDRLFNLGNTQGDKILSSKDYHGTSNSNYEGKGYTDGNTFTPQEVGGHQYSEQQGNGKQSINTNVHLSGGQTFSSNGKTNKNTRPKGDDIQFKRNDFHVKSDGPKIMYQDSKAGNSRNEDHQNNYIKSGFGATNYQIVSKGQLGLKFNNFDGTDYAAGEKSPVTGLKNEKDLKVYTEKTASTGHGGDASEDGNKVTNAGEKGSGQSHIGLFNSDSVGWKENFGNRPAFENVQIANGHSNYPNQFPVSYKGVSVGASQKGNDFGIPQKNTFVDHKVPQNFGVKSDGGPFVPNKGNLNQIKAGFEKSGIRVSSFTGNDFNNNFSNKGSTTDGIDIRLIQNLLNNKGDEDGSGSSNIENYKGTRNAVQGGGNGFETGKGSYNKDSNSGRSNKRSTSSNSQKNVDGADSGGFGGEKWW